MVVTQPGRLIRVMDLGPVRAFLDARPIETLKLRGFLEQEPPDCEAVWADDPQAPRAVVIEANEWYNVAVADGPAARQVFVSLDSSGGEVQFAGLPRGLVGFLAESHEVIRENPCYLYYLRPERFRPQLRHPVQPLRPDDAPLVAELWGRPERVEYCRRRILHGPTCAVYEGVELVAFAVTHADGAIGMLHTREARRRQGLGRSVTTALVQQLLARGRLVYCFIVQANAPSIRLFEGLGFERVGEVSWVLARPRRAGAPPRPEVLTEACCDAE